MTIQNPVPVAGNQRVETGAKSGSRSLPVAEQARERVGDESREPRVYELASAPLFARLSCGHDILWDDPDEDVNGSHYCPKCGLYCRVESFSSGAAS